MNEETPSQPQSPVESTPPPSPASQDSTLITEVAMIESESGMVDDTSELGETPPLGDAGNPQGMISSSSTTPPPRKSKKPFIVAGISVLILALFGGGAAFAYHTYQAPEHVMSDAMSHLLSTQKVHTTTTVTSNFAYTSGDMKLAFNKLTFTLGAERTPKVDTNATLDVTYNSMPLSLTASVLVTDEGALYFRVTNLKATLKAVLSDDIKLSATAQSYLDAIDGKWAKYTLSDIKASSPESGKVMQCTLDAYKKYKDDKKAIQEFVDLYSTHAFITTTDTPVTKDGNLGYVVSIDKTTLKAFGEGAKTTTLGTALSACDTSAQSKSLSSSLESVEQANGSTTTTVWVSQWTHELRAIDTTTTGLHSFDNSTYTISSHTDIDATTGVSTSAPSDTMSADEWGKNVQLFVSQLFMGS